MALVSNGPPLPFVAGTVYASFSSSLSSSNYSKISKNLWIVSLESSSLSTKPRSIKNLRKLSSLPVYYSFGASSSGSASSGLRMDGGASELFVVLGAKGLYESPISVFARMLFSIFII